ncbi:MAG: type I restriction endonuclease subunit R [Bacteroidaceae bacterium]|nr:type I restriction endonuclease subunit R [Bacteroidaceae bacterium]
MDTSEKQFERDIEAFLISPEGGYVQFNGQDANGNWVKSRQHDRDRCIYMDVLCEFIAKTQPKEWAKYQKYYGDDAQEKLYHRLETTIAKEGLLHVLRKGIEDMGCKIKVCYFKPDSDLNPLTVERYEANILGCTRQFNYSSTHNNTIDMVLSVNGIPVVAIELKNQLKGQDYLRAINQFKNDRSSKEFCFRPNHRFLVYFAVDLYQAWMSTQLADGHTRFLPFNQGSNGAGRPGGAGNPINENGYATSYLWEEVLQRDSLLDLLHRFISYVKEKEEIVTKTGETKIVTKEKMIFPRYHQYDVVKKVIADVKKHGAGTNYLIQHSAGSGKSNSIAWIAYRLASLHDAEDKGIFHSVIVVTNRVVLDGQLQDTINSFDHELGLVEAIDEKKNSRSLAEAINDKKRIIICTIQKFLFAHKDMEKFSGRRFAIIIDEAHQGQSGESARTLRRSLIDMGVAIKEYAEGEGIDESEVDVADEYVSAVLGQGRHKNQSFFAFTATPKGTTIETFGTVVGGTYGGDKPVKAPFHVYSMKQAIEEKYIIDVLANYTTIKEAFKLIKVSEDNPELIEGPAARAMFKYYKEHGYTIAQKTEMLMTNFLENCRYQIDGKGKAMVVASSRANAVRYYLAIKKYIEAHPKECAGSDVMIAFSGEVKLADYPQDKPFTEASMNLDDKGKYITSDKEFRKAFHSSLYNILVVANKYQTGFDEPLLHTMYVDKKLHDVAAVQTLSRLNRTAPGKTSTFILDFENTAEEIKDAFMPFYEISTMVGSTDINSVYDVRSNIRKFMLYDYNEVTAFNSFMEEQTKKGQDPTALGRLTSMLSPVIQRFKNLDEDEQYVARDYIRGFNKLYSYVTQLVRIHDKDLFQEYLYTSHLIHMLPVNRIDFVDIDDKIKLEYASLTETFTGAILLDEKPPIFVPIGDPKPKPPTKKKDTLQSIIDKVNERFSGNFTDADRVIIEGIFHMFMKDSEVKKFKKYAKDNNPEMFVKSLFPDKFKDIVTQCFIDNNDSFAKLFNDPDFYQKVQDAMATELYNALRRD